MYCIPVLYIVTFSPFFIFELKFLYLLIFLMILWFFFLISLNLLFQELPKAKLRFSQRSCIENLSAVTEILQRLRSWKWGFTIKCFRPLCVLVFGILLICVLLFIKLLRVISEEECCINVSTNWSEKTFHVKPGTERSSRLYGFMLEE